VRDHQRVVCSAPDVDLDPGQAVLDGAAEGVDGVLGPAADLALAHTAVADEGRGRGKDRHLATVSCPPRLGFVPLSRFYGIAGLRIFLKLTAGGLLPT
jgi:hypothetical protein